MAIGYYGGKAQANGKWICSMLPPVEKGQVYIETHAGMLGVMLRRPRADDEWANDLNPRLVNWWLVVRDRRDELIDKLAFTPHSKMLFDEYAKTLDEGDDLMRAVKMTMVLALSFIHGDGPGMSGLARGWGSGDALARRAQIESIKGLRDRMIGVQFYNEPAVEVLERTKSRANAVIYMDPPYQASATAAYHIVQQDYDETLRLLCEQQGRVAVSGYHDDWQALVDEGWYRSELAHRSNIKAGRAGSKHPPRTEVLWTNYDPTSMQSSLL